MNCVSDRIPLEVQDWFAHTLINMPRQKERQVSEAELEDLRNKFHLLEGDRKAYYEMSMHTMKSNKALVAQLQRSLPMSAFITQIPMQAGSRF